MFREASVKYHQKKEKRFKKASRKILIKTSLIRKKTKSKKQYGSKQYKNLSEDEKQKLVEYRKIYYEMRKNNSKVTQ